MSTIRNHGATLQPTATIPGSPAANTAIFWTPAAEPLIWTGTQWIAPNGDSMLWPAAGLADRNAAIVVAGTAVPCDPTTHTRCDGVVVVVSGGWALLRRRGLVYGFAGGLESQAKYHVATPAGSLKKAPASGIPRLIHVGVALDTSVLLVDVTRPVGIG